MQKLRLEMFLRFTLKQTYRFCFVLVYFVCHTPQFKMLVFAFQSEVWIAQNFNFSVFEVFCLSLSWKYRFSQNVNRAKFNPKPKSTANFTWIRQDKDCLRADFKSEVWSQKKCIETP